MLKNEIIEELKKLDYEVLLTLTAILLDTHNNWNWKELLTELKKEMKNDDRNQDFAA